MSSVHETLASHAERKLAVQDGGLRAIVRWEADAAAPCAAKVLDLSATGAKLSVTSTTEVRGNLTLELTAPAIPLAFEVRGAVCWSSASDGSVVSFGCRFDPPIGPELLGPLSEFGLLERRRMERQAVQFPAEARWELAGAQPLASMLEDVSSEGFRLRSSRPGVEGQRVLVTIEGADGAPIRFTGRCRWSMEEGSEFVAGCVFAHSSGRPVLLEAVRQSEVKARQAGRWFRLWPWS